MNLHPLKTTSNSKPPIQPSEFPQLHFSYSPSHDGVDQNLLILFHGLGDHHRNFIQFGKRMNLPQTAIIAIGGPSPIPAMDPIEEGSGWFPAFDFYGNDIPASSKPALQGLLKTRALLIQFIQSCVFAAEGRWKKNPQNVFLFGFSQGGCVALDVGLSCAREGVAVFGGVISVCGWLEDGMGVSLKDAGNDLSILVVQGNQDQVCSESEYSSKRKSLLNLMRDPNTCEVAIIAGKGHSMPGSNRDEVLKIMQFLSSRMTLRNLKLEAMSDVYEVK
ncbi:Alpha/Beta hydrolase protein, partial [Chytriomyces cf. hyalinus JEL632]